MTGNDSACSWRGTNRRGAGAHGRCAPADLPQWVKGRFDARWQSLEVTYDGEEVARISRNNEGVRVWYALDLSWMHIGRQEQP